MDVQFTKGLGRDTVTVRRAGGGEVAFELAHKGPVPHDAVHLFVEQAAGLTRGFWGLVAAGHDPQEIGAMAKAAGHASAKRAAVPDADFVEAIQAERLVEAFEAEHWSGGADNDGVRAMAAAGCAQSLVPPLTLSDAMIEAARGRLSGFAAAWSALPVGETIVLHWPERAPA